MRDPKNAALETLEGLEPRGNEFSLSIFFHLRMVGR